MDPIVLSFYPGAEWVDGWYSPFLWLVVVLASIGTTLLFVVGVIAYRRRRTFRYLLITVVLGVLVIRTIVGIGTILGFVPMTVHHLVEHGFDFLMAALILYAIYRVGPVRTDDSAV